MSDPKIDLLAALQDSVDRARESRTPIKDNADTAEFWVIHNKRGGGAIWWWDGAKITLLVHQNDVIYGNNGNFEGRRAARARLWERITRDIPVARPCQHQGCDDVAIAHPTLCPAHITEETP